jgi:hypothetical protein
MLGARPRVGQELVLRLAWKVPTHTYMVTVSVTKDALVKYEKPIRALLESIELFEEK